MMKTTFKCQSTLFRSDVKRQEWFGSNTEKSKKKSCNFSDFLHSPLVNNGVYMAEFISRLI